jgi:toluene monooxygenase system ferredoxin subunit
MALRRAAAQDDLWSGEMMGVVVDGTRVVLVNVEGTVCAYEDRCVHQGVRLSEGRLEGGVVTCSAHSWQYDARTGEGVNPRGVALARFPVMIGMGAILVDVDERASLAGASVRREPDRDVGPVLETGPVAEAVAAAIRDLNEHAVVIDRGGYLRVKAPELCVLTREAVELHLGSAFRLPGDLEAIMPSFKGAFSVCEREARWAIEARR